MGEVEEVRECETRQCPVDCEWGQYGEWSQCSKSCDGGVSYRTRTKLREEMFGGESCSGDSVEIELCNKETCTQGKGIQIIFFINTIYGSQYIVIAIGNSDN